MYTKLYGNKVLKSSLSYTGDIGNREKSDVRRVHL